MLLTGRPVAFRHGRPSPQLPLFSLAIPPLPPRWRNTPHAKTNWFYLPLVLWGHILIWLIGCHCSSAVWMLVIFQHISRRKWVLEIFGEAGVKGQLNLTLRNFTFTTGCGLIYARCLFKRTNRMQWRQSNNCKKCLFLSFFPPIFFLSIYPSISFLSLSIFCVGKNLNIWRFPIKPDPFATLGIRRAQKWPFDLSQ